MPESSGEANETAAADRDSEQMVATEEALEEHEEDAHVVEHVEDARVESANGEAIDQMLKHWFLNRTG